MPLSRATYTTLVPPSSSHLSAAIDLLLLLHLPLRFGSICSLRNSHFGSIEMALASSRVSSPFLSTIVGDALRKPISSSSSSSVSFAFSVPSAPSSLSLVSKAGGSRNFKVYAVTGTDSPALTGVIFEPFEEVKKDILAVPMSPQVSMARQNYVDECESAINEQINVEYNVSYVYHSMFAYFDRDNVALRGLAKFFKESSEEEREHAEKLMEYQVV